MKVPSSVINNLNLSNAVSDVSTNLAQPCSGPPFENIIVNVQVNRNETSLIITNVSRSLYRTILIIHKHYSNCLQSTLMVKLAVAACPTPFHAVHL